MNKVIIFFNFFDNFFSEYNKKNCVKLGCKNFSDIFLGPPFILYIFLKRSSIFFGKEIDRDISDWASFWFDFL